jgi:hypothetical protein
MFRMHRIPPALTVLLLVFAWAAPAQAYVGPGAGLSLIGALWGLVVAVGAAVGFVVLWPLRRALRARRAARPAARAPEHETQDPAAR